VWVTFFAVNASLPLIYHSPEPSLCNSPGKVSKDGKRYGTVTHVMIAVRSGILSWTRNSWMLPREAYSKSKSHQHHQRLLDVTSITPSESRNCRQSLNEIRLGHAMGWRPTCYTSILLLGLLGWKRKFRSRYTWFSLVKPHLLIEEYWWVIDLINLTLRKGAL